MSTPLNHASSYDSSASHTNAHYILASTPPVPVTSQQDSTPSLLTTSLPTDDDLKSTSTPNIDPTTNSYSAQFGSGAGVELRTDKCQHPAEYRQSFPTSTGKYVRVISDGSPPSSPDLKFTRVARKTWTKHLSGDLSASTGNVMDEGRGDRSAELTGGSLRSFQSDELAPPSLERSSFLQKQATLSPLAAMSTSTPAQGSNTGKSESFPKKISPIAASILKEGDRRHRQSPANVRATPTTSDSSAENLLEIQANRPLKRGQLDIVRGVTEMARQSPMSSFILDSNLLDVSGFAKQYMYNS